MPPHMDHTEDVMDSPLDATLIRRLLSYLRPHQRWVAASVALMILGTAANLAFPLVTQTAIDRHLVQLYQVYETPGDPLRARTAAAPIPPAGVVWLDDSAFAVRVGAFKGLDPRLAEAFRRDPALRPGNQHLFPAGRRPAAAEVPGEIRGAWWLVPEGELRAVPRGLLLALRQADTAGLAWLALLAALLAGLNFVADYLHMLLLNRAGQAAMLDLRTRVFTHIQSLSLDYFSRQPLGRLITRVTNDIGALNDFFTGVIVQFFRDLLMFAGAVAILFYYDARLTWLVLITVPVFLLVTLYFRKRLREIYRTSRRHLSSLNAHLAEDIAGFKIIRIFRQGPRRRREYDAINEAYFRTMLSEVITHAFFRPTVEVVCAVGLTLVLVYGGALTLNGAMSLGAFVAFLTYVTRMFAPLGAISDRYTITQSAMAAAERLMGILDERPKITAPAAASAPRDPPDGRLAFEDVRFSYVPGQEVLKGVSFTVPAGRSVAIVGATGSGKTSILNLICRFYDVDSGCVRLGGSDVRTLPFPVLHRHLAIVLQEPFIFSRSVRENIAMGVDYPEERIRRAAALVQADAFIRGLKEGYDTVMEERGATLSAGQRQLLCFARALAHDPKVLILDEATSHVDPQTEQLIQQAIATLMQNRTCVIVAHRLSTIRKADEILVLDDGHIIERGTHDELLARRGAYYNLYLLQYQHE